MRPANLSRSALSWAPAGEACASGDGAEPLLDVVDELFDLGRELAGLLLEVLADRLDLTLEAAAVLLDGSLDPGTALAHFALELGAGLADLSLRAVSGGRAATPQ